MKRFMRLFLVSLIVIAASLVLGLVVAQAQWVRLGNENYVANVLAVCRSALAVSVGFNQLDNPNPDSSEYDHFVKVYAVDVPQNISDPSAIPDTVPHVADGVVMLRSNRFPIRRIPTTFSQDTSLVFPSFTYVYGLALLRWSRNFKPRSGHTVAIFASFPNSGIFLIDVRPIQKCFPSG